jgi:leucyl-tRNA synthetase
VVNPDDIIATYGADTMRVYEMFMGPFAQAIAWNTQSMIGSRRFIERIWNFQYKLQTKIEAKKTTIKLPNDAEILINQTIKKVTEDIGSLSFNTAISALMILVNKIDEEDKISAETFSILLKLVAPFAPHVADEIWSLIGNKKSVHISEWPQYNAEKLTSSTVKVIIQVNGKMRGSIDCDRDDSKESIIERAKSDINVKKWIDEKVIKKEIYVPGKLVSIVVD